MFDELKKNVLYFRYCVLYVSDWNILPGFSRSGGLYDDEGYYSSVMFPAEYNAYEHARPVYPIPPPAATIPQTLPKSYADNNFRIISEYPVPITELWL